MDKKQKKEYRNIQDSLWIRICKGYITLEEASIILDNYKQNKG